ncbi:MAG TPA: ABC transporter permease subunit [Candidatus Limnocylindrales bacterium]|nr:ABC transporter permease subunit [Candidatus Limnocylindrales bacterium]
MTAFRMELRRNRSLTVWLGVMLLGYGAVMGAMYPVMVENDEVFKAYMASFPKELLAAFGMTGSLSDPGVFYTTYIASWLWPIMAAIAALLIGTRAVAADLDRGFLDLPLSTRVSRTRYLGASIAGQAIVMAVLAVTAVAGVWIVGRLVDAQFDARNFALAGVLSWLFGCAIAAVATLLSVLTLSRGRAAGIVAGILVLMYLAFVVTQISADWAWLAPISAWDHFETTPLIDSGVVPAGDMALFAVIAIAGWVAALIAFRGRDLAA